MKIRLSIIVCATICCLLHCSTPTGNEKAAWQVNCSVPLLQKQLFIQDLIMGDAAKNFNITSDSTKKGDTLQFSIRDTFINHYFYTICAVKDTACTASVGVMRLKDIQPWSYRFAMNDLAVHANLLGLKNNYQACDTIQLSGIDHVTFDSSSGPITIGLFNGSSHFAISAFFVRIVNDKSETVIEDSCAAVLPGQNIERSFASAGLTITHSLTCLVQLALPDSAYFTPGDTFGVLLSINRPAISEAAIIDSLIDQHDTFSATIPVGDAGFKLDFIDIDTLRIPLEFINPLPFEVTLRPTIANLLDQAYCKNKGILSSVNLDARPPDSSACIGNTLAPVTITAVSPENAARKIDLKICNARLLPAWNTTTNRNELS
ncbi:MAG: hypothetical protein PHC61_12980, partial [Chitinivibrionales bacterium]|nr:hypothetical protein [Chitinivibrionales bacterium]